MPGIIAAAINPREANVVGPLAAAASVLMEPSPGLIRMPWGAMGSPSLPAPALLPPPTNSGVPLAPGRPLGPAEKVPRRLPFGISIALPGTLGSRPNAIICPADVDDFNPPTSGED